MKIQLIIVLILTLSSCGRNNPQKTKPDSLAVVFNNKAVDFIMQKKLDSALFCINRAIEIDSNLYSSYHQKISILWGLYRNEEALEVAKQMSSKGQNRLMEGFAYERLNNLDKAKKIYEQVIATYDLKDANYSSIIEFASLVTVVEGRDRGLEELNKIELSKLNSDDSSFVKRAENEIRIYHGGGHAELFAHQPLIHYCTKTSQSIKQFEKYLLQNGINPSSSSSNGENVEFETNQKFMDKAMKLGFKECKGSWSTPEK